MCLCSPEVFTLSVLSAPIMKPVYYKQPIFIYGPVGLQHCHEASAMFSVNTGSKNKRNLAFLGSSCDLGSGPNLSRTAAGLVSKPSAGLHQAASPDVTAASEATNGLVHAKSTGSLFGGGVKKLKQALK